MSDPVLELTGIFRTGRDAVLQACEAWVEETTADALKLILEIWPDEGPAHPYATGKSLREFKIEVENQLRRLITNEAERKGRVYPGYTEQGYTRKGPYTARPYFAAGQKDGEGYIAKVIADNEKRWLEDLEQRMEAALRG